MLLFWTIVVQGGHCTQTDPDALCPLRRCLDLVERVRVQLEKRLKEVDWMTSDETRRQALEKMAAFGCKIGFPDAWVVSTHNLHAHLSQPALRSRTFAGTVAYCAFGSGAGLVPLDDGGDDDNAASQ